MFFSCNATLIDGLDCRDCLTEDTELLDEVTILVIIICRVKLQAKTNRNKN